MHIWKGKVRLLSLLMTSCLLSMNLQPVGARTTNPVGNTPVGNYSGALLPTGLFITPAAAPGSTFDRLSTGLRPDGNADAAEAVTTALSPDGKTLLVLTSGYNQNFKTDSGTSIKYPVLDPTTGAPSSTTTNQAEWVFVYDVSSGSLVKKQQINIPNTYDGLAWAPDGKHFYVSAGIDDRIYAYSFNGNQATPEAPFILLNHNTNQTAPLPNYDGGLLHGSKAEAAAQQSGASVATGAVVAGVAVSKDGKTLVAANFENDSISIVNTSTRKVTKEIRFFVPGGTVPTGEFPYDVAVKSDSTGAATTAYVSSQRDDEVVAVNIATGAIIRIKVGNQPGSQPNKMLLSPDQSRLYVANGNDDSISVINTTSNQVVQTISLSRSGAKNKYKGSNPNSLALSPDGNTLYVTLGTENAVAVVNLTNSQVAGRIPTGWYPNSVTVSKDGTKLYVVNAKSNSGPNPANSRTTALGTARNTTYKNQYNWALEKAGISTIPVPSGGTLAALTQQVDINNGFNRPLTDPVMTALQGKIKHIIYIVKENRTYDQVLGDLPHGNGDPSLTLFPQRITPNHHELANQFVILDNFYDSGESSGVGWSWSTFARTTDYTEKTQSVLYGNANFNGLTYDYEGTNRNINPCLPQTQGSNFCVPPAPISLPPEFKERVTGMLDPTGSSSILPGTRDVNAPEGDSNTIGSDDTPGQNVIGGYLWDAAIRAGKSVRNYGFFVDQSYYNVGNNPVTGTQPNPSNPFYIPISKNPYPNNPQAPVTKLALQNRTDIYFRSFDQKNPDLYLYNEWTRDVQQNGLPNLMLLRLAHDHFGEFSNAVDGLNTPSLQMADNDYAVGKVVQYVSQLPEWKSTAIFVIEDDSQNGPDHVDSHRSIGYIISPYTRRGGTVIHTNYNTISMLRTIEDLLGIDHVGITDANAEPMSDAFTLSPNYAPYTAVLPGNLCKPPVNTSDLVGNDCINSQIPKTLTASFLHNGQWWAQQTKDYDFSAEDRVDAEAFNQLVWTGIKGDSVPYPTERSGADLSQNREELLKNWHLTEDKPVQQQPSTTTNPAVTRRQQNDE